MRTWLPRFADLVRYMNAAGVLDAFAPQSLSYFILCSVSLLRAGLGRIELGRGLRKSCAGSAQLLCDEGSGCRMVSGRLSPAFRSPDASRSSAFVLVIAFVSRLVVRRGIKRVSTCSEDYDDPCGHGIVF